VFQAVTAGTASGFTTQPQAEMTDFSKTATIALMFVGGSAGSTAGGLKIVRLMILLAAIPWLIRKYLLPPTAVQPLKIGEMAFHDKEVMQVTLYFFLYMFVIAVGTLIVTAHGFPFMDSLFETTSAAGTIGLSTGIASFTAPVVVKVVLIFEMFIGRLEILPILALIGAFLHSKKWGSFYD
jgi:trk system potassium uptake protein TrkH